MSKKYGRKGVMSELRLHKTNSIFRILCFFIILFFNPTAFSQTIPKTSISGNVVDASTGKPLHFANVFLNNTTLGCATDENGGFSIERIPLGTYSLVASMMGYELEIRQIMLTESDLRIFEISETVFRNHELCREMPHRESRSAGFFV
jgi:hypothetical protein